MYRISGKDSFLSLRVSGICNWYTNSNVLVSKYSIHRKTSPTLVFPSSSLSPSPLGPLSHSSPIPTPLTPHSSPPLQMLSVPLPTHLPLSTLFPFPSPPSIPLPTLRPSSHPPHPFPTPTLPIPHLTHSPSSLSWTCTPCRPVVAGESLVEMALAVFRLVWRGRGCRWYDHGWESHGQRPSLCHDGQTRCVHPQTPRGHCGYLESWKHTHYASDMWFGLEKSIS